MALPSGALPWPVRTVLAAVLAASPTLAEPGALLTGSPVFSHETQVFAPDAASGDAFGFAVSVHGDTAVVGAHLDDTPAGVNAGSAHVFVRSGGPWIHEQKLVAADGEAEDFFGGAVAVSGDTVVVGAYRDWTPGGYTTGSAYVFVRSGPTWTLQQHLIASDATSGDQFGRSVSISGDTIVVGAYTGDAPGGADAGSAYVFVRSGTTWTQQQKLVASDGADSDYFGWSVSISGDTVLVGAPYHDASAADAGAAYVYARSGTAWAQQQKLVAVDGAAEDYFGQGVSVSGDTAVIGAWRDDTPGGENAGSAYVFTRAGTSWTEQQKLLASDAAPHDAFGLSLSISGDVAVIAAYTHDAPINDEGTAYVFTRVGTAWTERQSLAAPRPSQVDYFGSAVAISGGAVVVGAMADDTPAGSAAGSAHLFGAQADLVVSKTDGQATAVPGDPLTYAIVASNAGPGDALGVTVTDVLPAALLGATWTCVASAGSNCAASGAGNINDTASLAVGGTTTYTVTGTIAAGATGSLTNTATVSWPGSVDPDPANNSATDTDTLTPEADLGMTKTDSADPVDPGDPLAYNLTVTNSGPSDATGITLVDALPSAVTFVSSVPGPPACSFGGGTLSCSLGGLAAGGNSSVTINVTVNSGASGILVNTGSVTGATTEPDPTNNAASAATAVGRRDGELAHGTDAFFDLAAEPGPVADEDVFRFYMAPYSSYEIVVDATSGDIGTGNGPSLERIGADGTTVLQSSVPVGVGPSRSLRFENLSSTASEGEAIRVRSASCTTDCGPDDVYRIRAYETTYSVPRFNNAGTQITVLVLQNPTNSAIDGEIFFRLPSGALVATTPLNLSPRQTLVLNTATVANGASGTITIAHDGRYGELSGKTVALEPATGFSFDSALEPRRK